MSFTEIPGVLKHHIEDDFHTSLVHLVDERLERNIGIRIGIGFSHVAVVDF